MRKVQGFTLLELLIAISIFAVISSAAYRLLHSATNAREAIDDVFHQLSGLQRLQSTLENDFSQVVLRPARNQFGDVEPAFFTSNQQGGVLSFTRAGWRNPRQEKRSSLQRVVYTLMEDRLIRSFWPVVDRAYQSEVVEQVVLNGIREMDIQYLNYQRQWQDSWTASENLSQMPIAIKIKITHAELDDIPLVFPMVDYQAVDTSKQGAKL